MLRLLRSSQGKLLIPMLIGVVVVGAAGGTLVFGKFAGKKQAKAPEVVPEALVSLEEIIVNLADSREPHYLKTTVALCVRGAKAARETEEAMPKIRDGVIATLSTRFYADLLVPEGKAALKEAIKARVNRILKDSKVIDVYYTDFAMQ